jgi:hypothetical protein
MVGYPAIAHSFRSIVCGFFIHNSRTSQIRYFQMDFLRTSIWFQLKPLVVDRLILRLCCCLDAQSGPEYLPIHLSRLCFTFSCEPSSRECDRTFSERHSRRFDWRAPESTGSAIGFRGQMPLLLIADHIQFLREISKFSRRPHNPASNASPRKKCRRLRRLQAETILSECSEGAGDCRPNPSFFRRLGSSSRTEPDRNGRESRMICFITIARVSFSLSIRTGPKA